MSSFGFNTVLRRPPRAANVNTLLPGTIGASSAIHNHSQHPSQTQQPTSSMSNLTHSASSSQMASKSRMPNSLHAPQHPSSRPFPSLATVTRVAAASAPASTMPISSSQSHLQPPHPPEASQHPHHQSRPYFEHNAHHIPFIESVPGTSEHERERGDDHFHWVYATTREVLIDVHSGEEVAGPSERVLLVYPMHNHTETGTVQMRLKQIDPITAQLSLRWVTVYNSSTNERLVSDFSLIP